MLNLYFMHMLPRLQNDYLASRQDWFSKKIGIICISLRRIILHMERETPSLLGWIRGLAYMDCILGRNMFRILCSNKLISIFRCSSNIFGQRMDVFMLVKRKHSDQKCRSITRAEANVSCEMLHIYSFDLGFLLRLEPPAKQDIKTCGTLLYKERQCRCDFCV